MCGSVNQNALESSQLSLRERTKAFSVPIVSKLYFQGIWVAPHLQEIALSPGTSILAEM